MYAESFGIATPADAGIETAAKWVQWAQYGIMQGASENEQAIRYNLDQFWKYKATQYPIQSAEGRRQLELLDTWAHGLWSALEQGKVQSSPAGFSEWVRSRVTGTAPVRPEAVAATAAVKAAAVSQQRAALAAQSPVAAALASLGVRDAAQADAQAATAEKWWTGTGPFGIPKAVWIGAGVVAVLGAVVAVRGNR